MGVRGNIGNRIDCSDDGCYMACVHQVKNKHITYLV